MKKLLVSLALITTVLLGAPRSSWPTVSNTTVSTTTAHGDGVTTNFALTFDFRDNSWLVVTQYDTSVSPATATVIPQGTFGQAGHWYPHSGVNPCVSIDMGTAPTSTQYLVFTRSIPLKQTVVFNPASIFPYAGLSSQLDQVTLTLQNLNASLGNGGGTTSSGGSTVSLPTALAYNFLGWDSLGASVVNYPAIAPVANDILKFSGSTWAPYQFTQSNLMSTLNSSPNTPLAAASGGAGVSNSGNLTWGSNAITLTTSGTTNLTLPTSGTVLTGTATNNNTASTIVKRDASGNFSAGTVTANLAGNVTGNVVGNVTGNVTGTAANVTGIVAIGNGGTGQTTRQTAINGLLAGAAQPDGYFARWNGTNVGLDVLHIGDVPQGFSRMKLAQGTANTVVINDGSGNLFDLPGTNSGDVLTWNGLTWVSAAAGAFTIGNGVATCTDTGVADAYICAPTPAPASQNPGLALSFNAVNANTGAATINVSGLGVTAIKAPGGGALVAGDILAGQRVELIFDGTNYQMVSPQGPAVATNTANRIVRRDASGNFSAGTITASLTGHSSLDLAIASNLSDVASPSSSFNNISPVTTLGDIIYGSGVNTNTRLAGNITTTKKFLTQTGTSAVSAAPAWSTIVGADMPLPSSSSLGGIQSYAAVSNQWINAISTLGVPSSAQPAFSNLSGNISTSQMNSGTSASSSTFWRGDGTWASVASSGVTTLTPVTKTGSYNVASTDGVNLLIADTTSSSFTFTLPAASGVSGIPFHIVKIGNNTLTIARSGSDLIMGETSQTIGVAYTSVIFYSDGSAAYYSF